MKTTMSGKVLKEHAATSSRKKAVKTECGSREENGSRNESKEKSGSEKYLISILKQRMTSGYIKRSNEYYHRALAYALRLYSEIESQKDPAKARDQVAERIGFKPTKKTSLEHIVVRAVINYGGSEHARKYISRDAFAIRYLVSRGISSKEVVELGARKGESIVAWSERGRAIGKRNKPGVKVKRTAVGTSDCDVGQLNGTGVKNGKSAKGTGLSKACETDQIGKMDVRFFPTVSTQNAVKTRCGQLVRLTPTEMTALECSFGQPFWCADTNGKVVAALVVVQVTDAEPKIRPIGAVTKLRTAYVKRLAGIEKSLRRASKKSLSSK